VVARGIFPSIKRAEDFAVRDRVDHARFRPRGALKLLELSSARRTRGPQPGRYPTSTSPDVAIRPTTAGGEVVEDYRHVGLSLRRHPVEFLRADLAGRRIVTSAEAMAARDGRWLEAAGLVLVRQSPGSAKGVMFITLEEKTGIANVVVWPSFEPQRRVVLSAGMLAVRGKIQREGAVVHLVAHHLTDLLEELASAGRIGANKRSARQV
jgi:error-prone DNA polymerase